MYTPPCPHPCLHNVQEGGSAVGMALSEPLGGGMFASNVVFGLVVLIASKQDTVIQRLSFLKDVYFYLVSLLVITLMLADGKVRQQPTADCRNVSACM